MNYQEFCKEFKQGVLKNKEWKLSEERYKFYPDGFTANDDKMALEFIRDTNIRYHSMESDVLRGDFAVLSIGNGDFEVDCRFFMKYLFEEFEEGGWNRVWLIVNENIKMTGNINVGEFANAIDDYEAVKERLIIRPINYTNNQCELKNVLHKVCGDVALVLYAIIQDGGREFGTTKIHKKLLEVWKREWDEVFNEALVNTNKIALPRIFLNPWESINPPYDKGVFMETESDVTDIRGIRSPMVTTTRRINGAIAMFYPGVKEKIAELIDGSYYTVFTGIHEAVVHRVGTVNPRMIMESLSSVNEVFSANEMLSQKVFLYDAEKKTFEPLEI